MEIAKFYLELRKKKKFEKNLSPGDKGVEGALLLQK
jgi:hypothetical protein